MKRAWHVLWQTLTDSKHLKLIMKKIYLIKRTDSCHYDEYDSVVIIAKTPKEAKELAYKRR